MPPPRPPAASTSPPPTPPRREPCESGRRRRRRRRRGRLAVGHRELEVLEGVLELDALVEALGLEVGELGAELVALRREVVELLGPLLPLGGGLGVLRDRPQVLAQLLGALVELAAA